MKTKLTLFVFFLFALGQLYKYTHDFRVDYIASPITYHPEWEIKGSPTIAEVKHIFSQDFYYLGKGGQAYAFESADGKYVLKFLKFKFLEPRLKYQLASYIPFLEDKQINEQERRIRKFYDLYLGYKTAFERQSPHTGLVYLHFNPTFHQFGTVTLFDRKGLKHDVDLDQTAFIVQKKSIMLNDLLAKLLNDGNVREARQKIESILEMYVSHYRAGLHDLGYGVIHNTGFVDNLPIHVDLGKMTWDEEIMQPQAYYRDLDQIASKIKEWLKSAYPSYHTELAAAIDHKLQLFSE